MFGKLHRFFTNVLCGLIYNKDTRKRVRVVLNSPMGSYIRFIRKNIGVRIRKLKTFVGYQARNLLISVNDKYIYKFPLRRTNSNDLALREKRIVDALTVVSPIAIPSVDVIKYRGVLVRRYPFVCGMRLREIPSDVVIKNIGVLAPQLARFLYDVGCADPKEIRDLKPDVNAKPGYKFGWFHGDVGDNFMIDIKNMKIIAFIDWEDCFFGDFSAAFTGDKRSPNRELMRAVMHEYDILYNGGKK